MWTVDEGRREDLVRLPGVACYGLTVVMALRWLRWQGISESRAVRGFWILVSFAGFSALAWMMVPEKAFSGTTKWKTTLESAQLAYAVGIAIQVARSF